MLISNLAELCFMDFLGHGFAAVDVQYQVYDTSADRESLKGSN